jgi:iron complex outermembrane receptor protein/outer membrane receptor for ferrienterochelin and colicins
MDQIDITLNQAFFYTNISQPVYDSSSTSSQIALINASKGLQTRGLQTYARMKYKVIELYLGYVFTDVVQLYQQQYKTPAVTPKHNFATTIVYEPNEDWRIGVENSLIAGQLDEHYNPVKNYFLFAAMIQYNLGKVSFVLNGENLLDFRQNKYGKIYDGSISNPTFHKLWAPIDGRVINLSIKYTL